MNEEFELQTFDNKPQRRSESIIGECLYRAEGCINRVKRIPLHVDEFGVIVNIKVSLHG